MFDNLKSLGFMSRSTIRDIIGKVSNHIRKILCESIYERIKLGNVTTDNLDMKILEQLENQEFEEKLSDDEVVRIRFSEPEDNIYKERPPFDLLCEVDILKNKTRVPFRIHINNKYGDLYSKSKNDITTYNNLIRIYTGFQGQRFKLSDTEEFQEVMGIIHRRVNYEEIVCYGVFVVDNKGRGSEFFLLEEVDEDFYINPRNTMLQIHYKPKLLKKPRTYKETLLLLLESVIKSLEQSKKSIQMEISNLTKLKEILGGLK